MLTIYKYTIDPNDYVEMYMPRDAQILTVNTQIDPNDYSEKVQLWALVDHKDEKHIRKFRLVGTGHPIEESIESLNYIGTFQMSGGALIFHLFELKEV